MAAVAAFETCVAAATSDGEAIDARVSHKGQLCFVIYLA